MAKRSDLSDDGQWVEHKPEVIKFDLAEEGLPTKALQLTKDVTLKAVGAVSGIEYIWNGAGSVVDVDERDVPALLNRPSRKSCCGSVSTPYFVVLEG